MAPAVDHNGTIAVRDQSWNLESPIATVPQATMQQDGRCADAVSAVPDPGPVVFDIAQIVRDRKWRGAARFEFSEFVIVGFHTGNDNAGLAGKILG